MDKVNLMDQGKGYFVVVASKSGKEHVIFSHTSSVVYSSDDPNEILAHPTGGKAVITGKILRELK